MHAADELRRAFEAAGSVFCVAARQMTAAATHLQKPLLGDVPKFPLVSMECGGRRRSCHDGRIPYDTSIMRAGNHRRLRCRRWSTSPAPFGSGLTLPATKRVQSTAESAKQT